MEETRQYADKINLAAIVPSDNLSETTYCLTDKGKESLVFQAGDRGEFTVNPTDALGTFSVEWFNANAGTAEAGKPVKGRDPGFYYTLSRSRGALSQSA